VPTSPAMRNRLPALIAATTMTSLVLLGCGSSGGGEGGAPGSDDPAGGRRPPGPGPAESSGRLWVPGR